MMKIGQCCKNCSEIKKGEHYLEHGVGKKNMHKRKTNCVANALYKCLAQDAMHVIPVDSQQSASSLTQGITTTIASERL